MNMACSLKYSSHWPAAIGQLDKYVEYREHAICAPGCDLFLDWRLSLATITEGQVTELSDELPHPPR